MALTAELVLRVAEVTVSLLSISTLTVGDQELLIVGRGLEHLVARHAVILHVASGAQARVPIGVVSMVDHELARVG